MKLGSLFVPSLFALLAIPDFAVAQTDSPAAVSLCELHKNPAAYDGKEIRVRGKINLEFEDFTIYDLNCNKWPYIWLMFGGDVSTPTKSTWNDTNRKPGKNVSFWGKEYALVKDASFNDFLKNVTAWEKKRPVYRVTATLTGAFFAQDLKQDPKLVKVMPGFGHMGCCRLLIINQFQTLNPSL